MIFVAILVLTLENTLYIQIDGMSLLQKHKHINRYSEYMTWRTDIAMTEPSVPSYNLYSHMQDSGEDKWPEKINSKIVEKIND